MKPKTILKQFLPNEQGQSAFDMILIIVGAIFIIWLIVSGISWVWNALNQGKQTPPTLVLAGKVVNSETGDWPDDRLVLVFLKGKEIGRSTTTLGEFTESKLRWTGLSRQGNGLD